MVRETAGLWAGLGFLLALSPAASGPAIAAGYQVAGRALDIEAPPSYCLLDPGIPAEAELFGFMEDTNAGRNRVLVVFVDCDELESWRRGEVTALQHYGNVLTPVEQTVYPDMARNMFLDELSIAMGGAAPLGAEAGEMRLLEAAPTLEIGQSESLGILEADDLALYAGIARKLEFEGRARVVLGIYSMTLVNAVPLSVNLFQPLEDDKNIERLIAHQRRFLKQLLERNRNVQGSSAGASPATPG
jgi:hypothetical protein